MTETVDLLELASTAVASSISAGTIIRQYAKQFDEQIYQCSVDKNQNNRDDVKFMGSTRAKADGTLVTDADSAAQFIIVGALRQISKSIRIVSEEDRENSGRYQGFSQCSLANISQEVYHTIDSTRREANIAQYNNEEILVEPSRISVFVDPLDGTNQYAKGNYGSVSTLVGIVVDNVPIFGVICKPFGQESSIFTGGNRNSDEVFTLYGGILTKGVHVYGHEEKVPKRKIETPKAVISSSRSNGIVRQCIDFLHEQGSLAKDPALVSGAGEKGLRLVIGGFDEAAWLFPLPGTSLWDVAASDAILSAIGGKLTNRLGENIDYSPDRKNTDNNYGIVAASTVELHALCLKAYQSVTMTAS